MTYFIVNFGIPFAYLLIAAATILAIVFPIMHMSKHPGLAKGALMGFGALLLIFLIAYLFSSGDAIYGATDDVIGIGTASRITGTGIITFYIFMIAAVIAVGYNEFRHARNK